MNKSESVDFASNLLNASSAPLAVYKPIYMTMAMALTTCLLVADLNAILTVPFWLALLPVYAPIVPVAVVIAAMLAFCAAIVALIIVAKIVQLVFKSLYYVCRTIYRIPRYFRNWRFNVNSRKMLKAAAKAEAETEAS